MFGESHVLIRQQDETIKRSTFGRRRVAPRVCVVDRKQHVRKFLRESLEDLSFIVCEVAHVDDLRGVLDAHHVDLVVLGLSSGGLEAVSVLEVLAAGAFDGSVLVLGPHGSFMVPAVQEFGAQLGVSMLPVLATPFDNVRLQNSVGSLIPVETPPDPIIDAAEALNAGWLELWYQPKFNTRTLRLDGAEALIRVRHPAWGVVRPAYFLPGKHDPYLRDLSEFVIARVVDDWRKFVTHHSAIELSINLPICVFQDPNSIIAVCRQMPDHPAFGGLIIEIDAADIIDNLDLAKAAARQLRFGNVGISVDNLGSEWPSLIGVDEFPFVEIKVDRQFVAGCASDRLKQTVCRRILDLAGDFGARTVAAGVETRADYVAMREMEFEQVQGFLFAKPMPAKKFTLTTLRQSALEKMVTRR